MLSSELQKKFNQEGYLAPLEILSQEELVQILQDVNTTLEKSGGAFKRVENLKPHLIFPWADQIVYHPKLISIVQEILGNDISCWTTDLFFKNPADGKYVGWHQDSYYWGLEPDQVVTAWVALTESNIKNGCLKVIPGSHLTDQVPHQDSSDRKNILARGQNAIFQLNECDEMPIVLKAGQASIHHIGLLHSSGKNCSDKKRWGIAIRYISNKVNRKFGPKETALLVSGDPNDFFLPEKRLELNKKYKNHAYQLWAIRKRLPNAMKILGHESFFLRCKIIFIRWSAYLILLGKEFIFLTLSKIARE